MATDLHIYADLEKRTIGLVGTQNDIDVMIPAIQGTFDCESIKLEYPSSSESNLHKATIKFRGLQHE